MSEPEIDLMLEPRKVFINVVLIPTIRQVEALIYSGTFLTKAIRPLKGLIDSLDEQSQDRLAPQYEMLEAMERDINLVSVPKMQEIYRTILTYLHKTYLKEGIRRLKAEDLVKLEEEE